MTVDVSEGVQEVLEIRSTDNIEKIAAELCNKYNLDIEIQHLLIQTIKQNLFETELAIMENQIKEEESENEQSIKEQYVTKPIEKKARKISYPIINKHSKRIVERKGLARIPIYERLKAKYRQAKHSIDKEPLSFGKRKESTVTKKVTCQRDELFKPKINANSRLIVVC